MIRSHSCSSGASLLLSLSGFSPSVPLSFVRFSFGSDYSASVSSVPVLPASASQWLPRCFRSAFRLPGLSSSLPPGFPCFRFDSRYLAFCSFPFILPGFAPTAVPPVLPFCFRFRAFPSLPLSFVRFRSVLTTQPSVLSFPFFPFSPDGGSSGASFLFRPACFHAFLPIPVLSFLQFLSPVAVSPHSGYLSASAFFLSVPGLFPLAFALGYGYLAWAHTFSDTSRPLRGCPAQSRLAYITTLISKCQHLFLYFLNFIFSVTFRRFFDIFRIFHYASIVPKGIPPFCPQIFRKFFQIKSNLFCPNPTCGKHKKRLAILR